MEPYAPKALHGSFIEGNMHITGGYLNSRKVKAEKFSNIKPTLSKTRQGIFNSLATEIDFSGRSFLDMFGGSGIMSLEAISRGFSDVVTIEKDKRTAAAIKENFLALKVDNQLYVTEALKFLRKCERQFDVIFLDPPYDSDLYEVTLMAIKDRNILADGGIIVLEHPRDKNIDTRGFYPAKIKEYGDVSVTFLQ